MPQAWKNCGRNTGREAVVGTLALREWAESNLYDLLGLSSLNFMILGIEIG